MSLAEDHCLQPLLEWLQRLDMIAEEDINMYVQTPQRLFEELRNGYMLGKLAMIALPDSASMYREDMCINTMTR